ncbi:MAG TPA: hypothetical protein DCE42_30580 [Myxococcales bacterium]|nr:hypothetical protein [Myxococcales bacterium]
MVVWMALLTIHEQARQASLQRINILDSPREERFDRIVRTAQRLFGVPIAYIGLLDTDRMWFKSSIGLAADEIGRDHAMGLMAIERNRLSVVSDTTGHERLSQHPWVKEDPYVRFFAGVPLHDREGNSVGVLGVMDFRVREFQEHEKESLMDLAAWCVQELYSRDVHKVEERQRSSETRMRALLNNVRDGIITISMHGLIESFNPAAESLFGYTVGEIKHQNFLQLFATPKIKITTQEILKTEPARLSSILGTGGEAVARRKDGSEFPVELSISDMWIGQYRMFTVIIRDITERKRSEKALQESERRYRELFENANDLIQSVGPSGEILYVNKAWRQTLGYEPHEMETLAIWDVLSATSRTRYVEVFQKVIQGQPVEEFEVVFLTRSGSEISLEGNMNGKFNSDGEFVSTQGIFRDITQRKRIEEMKSEFISIVSHELRTPLTSIHGSLGLLLGGVGGELSENAISMIKIANSNSERLVRLISDILDIEKIESGKMDFFMEMRPLMPLIHQSIAENEGYAKKYNVSMNLTRELPEVYVYVDGDRLIQVLNNLLSNAMKFSPKEGVVEIAVERFERYVRVSVSDKGPGIPEELRGRIFDRFTQAKSPEGRRKGGSGLGLSICKTITERLKGQLNFSTRLGEGTTFYFDLLAHKQPTP